MREEKEKKKEICDKEIFNKEEDKLIQKEVDKIKIKYKFKRKGTII